MLPWEAWQLQYSQWPVELSENILQNLFNNFPPHTYSASGSFYFSPAYNAFIQNKIPFGEQCRKDTASGHFAPRIPSTSHIYLTHNNIRAIKPFSWP